AKSCWNPGPTPIKRFSPTLLLTSRACSAELGFFITRTKRDQIPRNAAGNVDCLRNRPKCQPLHFFW
ncbi:MAG: hypothetical protein AAAC49_00725, partial [Rhizobium leguminosarum]